MSLLVEEYQLHSKWHCCVSQLNVTKAFSAVSAVTTIPAITILQTALTHDLRLSLRAVFISDEYIHCSLGYTESATTPNAFCHTQCTNQDRMYNSLPYDIAIVVWL